MTCDWKGGQEGAGAWVEVAAQLRWVHRESRLYRAGSWTGSVSFPRTELRATVGETRVDEVWVGR